MSAALELRHQTNLSEAIDELKAAHASVVASVSAINTRLEAIEKQATTLQGCQRDMASVGLTDCLINEIITLRARLDDAEDRSRRDNLLFFDVADNPKESCQESEQKTVSFASEKLGLEIAAENIIVYMVQIRRGLL